MTLEEHKRILKRNQMRRWRKRHPDKAREAYRRANFNRELRLAGVDVRRERSEA